MTTLNLECQDALVGFFKQAADQELAVEKCRQKLASLYDFEPFAAFTRIDADGDKAIYCLDIYNFLQDNDRKQFQIKDVQLLMQFYDLDGGGSLSYNEFLKFILPCDDEELRE